MNKKERRLPSQIGPNPSLLTAPYPDDTKLSILSNNLNERVKELNCHYAITRLFEDDSLSLSDVLQGVVDSIPPAWQYPDITCSRLKLRGKEFSSANFRETEWRQTQPVHVNGKQSGVLEVHYLAKKPVCDEGPFLKEERNLLYIIAERLGHMVERQMAREKLGVLYKREKGLRKSLQSEMDARVDFTRKLIHELKTPLTALIATSQLLSDETQNDRIGKLTRNISESAQSLNSRIEELQDVVRGEIGILKLDLKTVNIKRLLNSLIEETRALLQRSGLAIELEVQEDIPDLLADPDRLNQIILNLINNAIKYAGEGQKIIIKAIKKEHQVQIEVRDFGPGINPERLKTIFEAGSQQSHLEARSGGLGIGLMLCKTLVELHGGHIWVKSKPRQGSRFFFSFPIKESKVQSRSGKNE